MYDIAEATFSIEFQRQLNTRELKNPILLKEFAKNLEKVGLSKTEALQILIHGASFTVEKLPSKLSLITITVPKYFEHFINRETNLIKKSLLMDVQPNTAEHLLSVFVDKVNNAIIGTKMKAKDKVSFKEHFYQSRIEYKYV
jgi:hypothetical protein